MKIELIAYLQYAIFTIEVLLVVWAANWVYDRIYGPRGPILGGNLAIAIQRAGMSLGCAHAMFSAMEHVNRSGFIATAWQVIVAGVVASVFVLIASWVNDKFITPKIHDNEEVRSGNVSVALVDASAAIATGFVTAASFSGSGPWQSVLVYFVLGQLALVVTARLFIRYAEVEQEHIQTNNLAAALSVGGILIATGITLRNAISGPFMGWQEDLIAFAVSYLVGMVTLFVVAHFVPRIFFGRSIHGEIRAGNTAVVAFTATMTVILAMAISVVSQ